MNILPFFSGECVASNNFEVLAGCGGSEAA